MTEIEPHSKTLQVVKRDVWIKENIVKIARTEYKMLGQFAERLITDHVVRLQKVHKRFAPHRGCPKGGNIDTYYL